MNTDALVYLLEIAETGSFNKAAQNLFISQPALRSTISKLEKDIGGPLLNRTKYGCTLTTLGQQVVEEAPLVLNTLNAWPTSGRRSTACPQHFKRLAKICTRRRQ